jgi:hypothetical protein
MMARPYIQSLHYSTSHRLNKQTSRLLLLIDGVLMMVARSTMHQIDS